MITSGSGTTSKVEAEFVIPFVDQTEIRINFPVFYFISVTNIRVSRSL